MTPASVDDALSSPDSRHCPP